jgi:uncharacterized protein
MEDLFKRDCVRTFSGQYFNLKDPDPLSVYPIDVATQLSRICRFGGATKKWYDVAQHSVWCATKCQEILPNDNRTAFAVLMHDAHEYIMSDLCGPVKEKTAGYISLANKVQNAIDARFRCWPDDSGRGVIKRIDRMALEWEWQHKVLNWSGLELSPSVSAAIFLEKFKELCKTPYVVAP